MMKMSTGSRQEQRRDELLRVATQLAAGLNSDSSEDNRQFSYYQINDTAIKQAKDLMVRVDAEFGEIE